MSTSTIKYSQWRPRWNAALCCISSVSALFARIKRNFQGMKYIIWKGAQWLSGRVLDMKPRVAGSSLTGVTALCPWARRIYPSLVLVQPRKTHPFITERLLMGSNLKNQTNKLTCNPLICTIDYPSFHGRSHQLQRLWYINWLLSKKEWVK